MKNLNTYITEKFKISKNTKVHFFELPENELIAKSIDVIENYNKKFNKHLKTDVHYDSHGGNNPWRADIGQGISYAYPTIAELYAQLVWDYGEEEEYKKVIAWKYDDNKKEWVKR